MPGCHPWDQVRSGFCGSSAPSLGSFGLFAPAAASSTSINSRRASSTGMGRSACGSQWPGSAGGTLPSWGVRRDGAGVGDFPDCPGRPGSPPESATLHLPRVVEFLQFPRLALAVRHGAVELEAGVDPPEGDLDPEFNGVGGSVESPAAVEPESEVVVVVGSSGAVGRSEDGVSGEVSQA